MENRISSALRPLNRLAKRRPGGIAILKAALQSRLSKVAEAALEVAVESGDPIGLVLADLIQKEASPDLARDLMQKCDASKYRDSVCLGEVALEVTKLAWADHQRQGATFRESLPAGVLLERVRLARQLGVRHSRLGQWRDALAYGQLSTESYRQFSDQNALAHRRELAGSYHNMGSDLSALGSRSKALQIARKAVELYKDLSTTSQTFLLEFAYSLDGLAAREGEVGNWQAALEAAEEAIEIYRCMAAAEPINFAQIPAHSLSNLGVSLRSVGRSAEAIEVTQEALREYRIISAERPDTELPGLAGCLLNLAACYSDLGQPHEALRATVEAVELWRQLAEPRAVYRPDLAISLRKLGTRLSELGHLDEAFGATDESVRIYRDLANFTSAKWQSSLVDVLGDLGIRLTSLGRTIEALAVGEEMLRLSKLTQASDLPPQDESEMRLSKTLGEALGKICRWPEALVYRRRVVDYYRPLASELPLMFSCELASSLLDFAFALRMNSEPQRAHEAIQEAILSLCEMTTLLPKRATELLPGSLELLSDSLAGMGRHKEAAESIQTALEILREGTVSNRAQLAHCLASLASRLETLGQWQDSVQAAREAVELARVLAQDRPGVYSLLLAKCLCRYGNCLGTFGRHQEALDVTRNALQALQIQESVMPDAFLPESARYLSFISTHLSGLGRMEESLDPLLRAIEIQRGLVESDRGPYLAELASSLSNLGNRWSSLGRSKDAFEATREALKIYADLAKDHLGAYRPQLATSLDHVSIDLRRLGLGVEARKAQEFAIEIRRGLAASCPEAANHRLARSLNNLAADLRSAEELDKALVLTTEAFNLMAPIFLACPLVHLESMRTISRQHDELVSILAIDPKLEYWEQVSDALAQLSAACSAAT